MWKWLKLKDYYQTAKDKVPVELLSMSGDRYFDVTYQIGDLNVPPDVGYKIIQISDTGMSLKLSTDTLHRPVNQFRRLMGIYRELSIRLRTIQEKRPRFFFRRDFFSCHPSPLKRMGVRVFLSE